MDHSAFERAASSSGGAATLQDVLSAVQQRPSVLEYQRMARELSRFSGELRPVRVALLATYTIDPLVAVLRVEAALHGFDTDVYVAPFNSVYQDLMNPDSGCHRHRPDVVFVSPLLADVCPPLANEFLSLTEQAVDQMIEQTVATCMDALHAFRARSKAVVIVSNFGQPAEPLLGIYEEMAQPSQTAAIRQLNLRLVDNVRSMPGMYVHDLDRLSSQVGLRRWHDAKMWHLARAPLAAPALLALGPSYATYLAAIVGQPRKCLVLDLDNTLWGGVIGEQGLGGIKLGHTYPGNAFREFQQFVLTLFQRGVLLAINSKNNPEDVQEVLEKHPDMILRARHFSVIRANWRDKTENIREIADELNIGLDSLVFFDDSPLECEAMRRTCPEVLTIQAPRDVLGYGDAVIRTGAFERLSFTMEDRRRTEMYGHEAERQRFGRSAGSVEDFLNSLQMTAEIRPVDDFAFMRAVELTQKTNQFNLTTRRYNASEFAEALEHVDTSAFTIRLCDRFGDYGIVGLCILHAIDDVAHIDTLLLSCRVIGRSAETALLSSIVHWARDRGLRHVQGEFIPTSKNAPAADFYPRHGFAQVAVTATGSTWRLNTAVHDVAWPACIHPMTSSVPS